MGKKDNKIDEILDEEMVNQNEVEELENGELEEVSEVSEYDLLKENLEREKERYLRLFAEFENYKKRTGRERIEMFKTAGQEVITAMLPVMDDFDRALLEIEKSNDDGLLKGVGLIKNKLQETLRAKGLEVMPVEKGDTFNADRHEAITQIPSPTPDLKGKIIDILEKGYTLGEKVIRFPKVVIGQ